MEGSVGVGSEVIGFGVLRGPSNADAAWRRID